MRRSSVVLIAISVGVALVGLGALAQEGILSFRIEPAALEVAPGGDVRGRIVVRNGSPREADGVEFVWAGPEAFSLATEPQSVSVVGAFDATNVSFILTAAPTAASDVRASLDAVYTYCIGELCFQVVESIPLALRVVPATQTASAISGGQTADARPAVPAGEGRWRWPVFALASSLVVAAAVVRVTGRRRVVLALALAAAGGSALGLGVWLDQHTQAQAVGAVLCTSCVGIETVERAAPRLSATQAAAVDRLSAPVELLVFYATWCRSCPYAEAMVDLVARRNPFVRYRLVNAESERELAADHGVTRSGRTVVPAVVRVDTGRVVFGAENLADRLVRLLEEGT